MLTVTCKKHYTFNYLQAHIAHIAHIGGVFVANITLSIPDVLRRKMKEHPEFKWSEVARMAIEEKINDAELMDDLKAIALAEKEFKEGKTLSHREVLKRLGG